MADDLYVVEVDRVIVREGHTFVPQCPATGCKRRATHEVRRGPKMVSRWCEQHAREAAAGCDP